MTGFVRGYQNPESTTQYGAQKKKGATTSCLITLPFIKTIQQLASFAYIPRSNHLLP